MFLSSFNRSLIPLRLLAISLLLIILVTDKGFSWVVHLDTWTPKLLELPTGTILLIDPDETSTKNLEALHKKGLRPLAWLNVGFHEPGRSYSAAMDPRTLTLNGKPPNTQRFTVRFFSAAWNRVLHQRIQEVANLGFRGLFLTGLDASQKLTDHPFALTEMINLCKALTRRFRGLTPAPFVVIDYPIDLNVPVVSFSFADSICLKGIWYSDPHRGSRHWEREPYLTRLFRQSGRPLLTIDDPPQSKQKAVSHEISALGADPAFFPLPMYPIRSKIP